MYPFLYRESGTMHNKTALSHSYPISGFALLSIYINYGHFCTTATVFPSHYVISSRPIILYYLTFLNIHLHINFSPSCTFILKSTFTLLVCIFHHSLIALPKHLALPTILLSRLITPIPSYSDILKTSFG